MNYAYYVIKKIKFYDTFLINSNSPSNTTYMDLML